MNESNEKNDSLKAFASLFKFCFISIEHEIKEKMENEPIKSSIINKRIAIVSLNTIKLCRYYLELCKFDEFEQLHEMFEQLHDMSKNYIIKNTDSFDESISLNTAFLKILKKCEDKTNKLMKKIGEK